MRRLIRLLLFVAIILASETAFASIKFLGYSYQRNFTAGETFNIRVTARNSGADINNAYFSPVLTNLDTGAEQYPAASIVEAVFSTGETVTFTTQGWGTLPPAGKYTVTLIIYNGADAEQGRISGAYPIRIGSRSGMETLKTFPTMMDFGVLPYGRHMHPIPMEITYDFFLYNLLRDQKPWYLRIYTDNATRYKGIKESVYTDSPAGLVSSDGRYTIPLRVWCLNYPPEDQEMGWDSTLSGPPPVDDDTYWKGPLLDSGERFENKAGWLRIPDYNEMTADRGTWRNLIGQAIYDTQYATHVNPTGDFTLKNPFSVYFATETTPTSVKGNYSCRLIVEIYSP